MSELYQNSIEGFLYESVKPGEIRLLVSGTLNGIGVTPDDGKWDWETGSWMHDENKVNAAGDWISASGQVANIGSLEGGAYLVGLAVSAYASGSETKEVLALEKCKRLKMVVTIGNYQQNLDCRVLTKQLRDGYVFLEVEEELLPVELEASMNVYFKNSGSSSDYRGYTCYVPQGPAVFIDLYPYTPPVESEEYNPILNNTMEDEEGTIARLVEPFEEQNPYFGTIRYEKATTLAEIPDSFYTSLANISARWLGTKNAEYHTYLGNKLKFTAENLEECEKDIQQNVTKNVYLVYQGSPYVLDATVDQDPIITGLSGSLKGNIIGGSRIQGELEGSISGSLSGYVTGIDLDTVDLTYYSSSTAAANHIFWTPEVNIIGTGTILYSNWKAISSGSGMEVTGSTVNFDGMTRFTGRYLFPNYTASGQFVSASFNRVSGSIRSWGSVEGRGQVDFTGSQASVEQVTLESMAQAAQALSTVASRQQADLSVVPVSTAASRQLRQFVNPDHLYLRNVQFSGLRVDDVTYGTLQVVPSGSVYISGTVGNVADGFQLHKLNGTLSVKNDVIQEVSLDHADSDGVVLSNVEIAEEAEATFNAFTANAVSLVQDFGGRAGFALTNGQVNVGTDGTAYIALVTQDQEDLGTGSTVETPMSTSTGSLPAGVDRFMQRDPNYSDTFTPSWDFSGVRRQIVATSNPDTASLYDEQGMLAEGTAILSGSFKDFEVQGTRKNLRVFRYARVPESRVPQSDIQQAVQLLGDLEAGVTFGRLALARSGSDGFVETSSITPRLVSRAVMPQRVFDAMVTASTYVVPGTDDEPIWSGSNTGSMLERNFDFFATGSEERQEVANFVSGSLEAIERLNLFLSGSLIDRLQKRQSGQFTYVYLDSNGTDYLKADIKSFSGSYVRFGDGTPGSQSIGRLTGSFQQIWGRFGEGSITRGTVIQYTGSFIRDASVPDAIIERRWPVSLRRYAGNAGIYGVIYGAFDFKGYVDGGYEGNMVEGTIEGDMAGVLSGIIDTGSIEGGPVQLTGVNRGSFRGSVKAGTFEGVMKNIAVTGNNLTDNLIFKGEIDGIEEFPLDGILSGSVINISLPGQCTYNLTGSANNGQLELHVPEKGTLTGQAYQSQSFENKALTLDLVGNSISISASFAGSVSGSVAFSNNGQISLPELLDTTAPESWSVEVQVSQSLLSGQFEAAGAMQVTTPEESPFSGRISTIPVDQPVSGTFDATVEGPTYVDLNMNGSLDNFRGHALAQGLVTIISGSDGNLVEAHDRPFFTLQGFSGSIFPEDTTAEAVQNMSISDMTIENLGFTSGMALVHYSTGSFGQVKEQEYVRNTLTLPQVGDIIYTSLEGKARVVSAKLYCPDLNALLTVNDRGTVVAETYLAQIQ